MVVRASINASYLENSDVPENPDKRLENYLNDLFDQGLAGVEVPDGAIASNNDNTIFYFDGDKISKDANPVYGVIEIYGLGNGEIKAMAYSKRFLQLGEAIEYAESCALNYGKFLVENLLSHMNICEVGIIKKRIKLAQTEE